jgi:hypothetical protein
VPDAIKKKSAMYVDGFNLYHSINDLNKPYLKWVNLKKLAQIISPSATEEIVRVVFCTAPYPGDDQKLWRHSQYVNALIAAGVACVKGHFVHEDDHCKNCRVTARKLTEKETDINLALSLINDAWLGIYEKAYLLSGDSDQAATAKLFNKQFPAKELISVSTPGRNFSLHILNYAHGKIKINEDHLERALFPRVVFNPNGRSAQRPREYDPPNGWVHPDDRPSKKK